MRVILASLAVVSLGGCDSSVYSDWSRTKTAERADIAEVNARNALARISELEGEIADLKSQVDTLESRLESEESNRTSKDDWAEGAIDQLYENDRIFAARTGLPFQEGR